MKVLPILIAGAALVIIAGCVSPATQKAITMEDVAAPVDTIATIKGPDSIINIAAVGDIMLGTAYPDSSSLPPDSARNSFANAAADLRSADIAFGNLEGVLLDQGEPAAMKLKFKSKPYLFKMPEMYGGIIKSAGFDVLSVGNNHSNDFGTKGRLTTLKVLDSLGIHAAGLKTAPLKRFVKNGVRYGFCAFSPNSQTVSLLDIKGAVDIIRSLKQNCDIVIVSFHGGGEGADYEHVPDTAQSFKGERRGDVKRFAHAAVDAGADLVLGHGPHVSRAMEVYRDRFIAYSLGNFCTYRSVSVAGVCGLAPLLKLRINKNGRFENGQILSYRQSHQSGLIRDRTDSAAKRIKALTEADLTDAGITISEDGTIARITGPVVQAQVN